MVKTNILLETGTNELEIIEFFIDEQESDGKNYRAYYGANVAKVLEIIQMPKVTSLPEVSHPSVLGSFRLRDRVIPLVDLSVWLGKEMVDTVAPKVIVTEFSNVITAFRVSGVTRIHRLSWQQVEAPNLYVNKFSNESITGVVQLEERVIFILDMEKIVGDINPKLHLRMEEVSQDDLQAAEQTQYKALIADDSSSIRHMIGRTLERSGFIVTRCINGKTAWEQLEEWKQKADAEGRPISDYVDVIISDIEMPEMDGHNLTKRIKDDPVLQHVPVILFSSLITDALRHKGNTVGANDQVSKPDLPSLTKRAKALIHEHFGK